MLPTRTVTGPCGLTVENQPSAEVASSSCFQYLRTTAGPRAWRVTQGCGCVQVSGLRAVVRCCASARGSGRPGAPRAQRPNCRQHVNGQSHPRAGDRHRLQREWTAAQAALDGQGICTYTHMCAPPEVGIVGVLTQNRRTHAAVSLTPARKPQSPPPPQGIQERRTPGLHPWCASACELLTAGLL